MLEFRVGELVVEKGGPILDEGAESPHLYTVLDGFGLRSKFLADGRRQVINFVMPGDLLGLQSALLSEMRHSVEATTKMTLCVFARDRFWELFTEAPSRAYSIVWLAAREERALGESLTMLGRKTALERVAAALQRVYRRASDLQLVKSGVAPMPWRQSDLADALGLSIVHTNKTLRKLRELTVADWTNGSLRIHDEERLSEIADFDPEIGERRPLF